MLDSPGCTADVADEVQTASPTFSVVLPTHDRPALLAEAVASVSRQTLSDWELVLVDDASTPPSRVSLGGLSSSRLRPLRHDQPQGGAASKAAGTEIARGAFVAFLDDDDLLDPRFLELTQAAFAQHPDLEVLFVGVEWFGSGASSSAKIHEEGVQRILRESNPQLVAPHTWLFDERLVFSLLHQVPMPFQRPIVRRKAVDRIGFHRSECLMWDCDWALRASLVARCGLLDLPLYRQRYDGQGYFSKPDRNLAQLKSAFEMTARLHLKPPAGTADDVRRALREAASRNAASLAYAYSIQGALKDSLSAWVASQRIRVNPRLLKIPAGAIARWLVDKLKLRGL